MMRTSISKALLGAAAIGLTLGGCGKTGGGNGASDPGAIKQAIKADETQWNKDFKSKDMERLSNHYADDAFFIAPGGGGADGSTEIRKVYATASTDPAFDVQFSSDKIDVAGSGDLAYARGKFTEKYTDKKTGKVMTDSGSVHHGLQEAGRRQLEGGRRFRGSRSGHGQGRAAREAGEARANDVVRLLIGISRAGGRRARD